MDLRARPLRPRLPAGGRAGEPSWAALWVFEGAARMISSSMRLPFRLSNFKSLQGAEEVVLLTKLLTRASQAVIAIAFAPLIVSHVQ